MLRLFPPLFALTLALAACADPVGAPSPPVDRPEDQPFPTGTADCAGLDVLRVAPWTGGGLQLTVAFDAPPADAAALTLSGLPNAAPRLALAQPARQDGVTAVVLVPAADADAHAARVAEARALVLAAPAGDLVIAWLGTSPPALLADATRDRAHALARLDATAPAAPRAPAFGDADRAAILATLDRLGGPWGPLPRDLHLVGAPGSRLVPRAAIRTLGACGPFPGGVTLTLASGDARCAFTTPTPDADTRELACDPAAAAADAWPYPDTIALSFPTAAARARFDDLERRAAEDDFDVTVTLGAARPVASRAHLRGQSSLGCARKNLTVNLGGATLRRLAPGVADDEFLLISLCLDEAYVNQAFANRLLRRLDLLPLDDRFVTVTVDGAPRGVYLLLERPVDTLRRDHAALAGVLRRRFDPEDKPEDIAYPADEAGRLWALERYRALTTPIDRVPAEALPAALAAGFDLDGYLRWLALMSYLHNGDFVDEAFFYVSDEAPGSWFRQHGWDSDDLFTPCHHQGRFALADPHGLAFCLEGDLDRALLVSDAVYARYAEILAALLRDLAPPALAATVLAETRDDLVARLRDDATCAAMTEVGAPDCAGLIAAIDARVAFMVDAIADRAAELEAALAIYRGTR